MKLTIFRGLPGSGKSTRARELSAKTGAIFIEPDMLMMEKGKYKYTPEKFQEAIRRCEYLIQTLTVNDSCEECEMLFPDIIYADVLPKLADVKRVISSVDIPVTIHSGSLEVIDCVISKRQSKERNNHNVKAQDIERMSRDWEPWDRVKAGVW